MKGSKIPLGSILRIGVVLVILVSFYAMAFFFDIETSKGNSFNARSLDLKIRDQDESYGDGVVATWKAEDMKPGDKMVFDVPFVALSNAGSIKGDHLEITCNYSVIEEEPCLESDTDCFTNEHPDEMAKEMIITKAIYRGYENGRSFCINLLNGKKYPSYNSVYRYCFGYILEQNDDWKIQDVDGDGKITFYDLKNDPLDNLPPANEESRFIMDVKFDENAGNEFQGDTFNLVMIFTLNQDASQ